MQPAEHFKCDTTVKIFLPGPTIAFHTPYQFSQYAFRDTPKIGGRSGGRKGEYPLFQVALPLSVYPSY